MSGQRNPLAPFIRRQGCVILDGGLATALEARGHDLNDSLWSARLLLDDPQAIVQVHLDYLKAGADVITTASYQASTPGLAARGLDTAATVELLQQSVNLATEARDRFWSDPANRLDRLRPLIAASIGPYGAYLADGSEYSGRYDLAPAKLAYFHRLRWNTLAHGDADLLACETIPSAVEAKVLMDMLADSPDTWAWLSFSCMDGNHLCDGTPLADSLAQLPVEANLAAVGVNCTNPGFISPLLDVLGTDEDVPRLVYPNLGEQYDPQTKQWTGGPSIDDWLAAAGSWREAGAVVVGGCCRVGPDMIAALRQSLLGSQ